VILTVVWIPLFIEGVWLPHWSEATLLGTLLLGSLVDRILQKRQEEQRRRMEMHCSMS